MGLLRHRNWKKKKNPLLDSSPHELRSFRFDEVEAATSGFHSSAFLGRGSHGSVFRASLEGGRLLAAAKLITSPPYHSSSSNEIDILSTVRSPLLVNLLGFTPDYHHNHHRIAVVELMPNGSLDDHLHCPSDHRPPIPWARRLRLSLQAAEAVHALHSLDPPVIHRDIKSSNVLIDARGNARLGDFGFAVRCGSGAATPLPAGTMGYLDPGYVLPGDLSTKSDVFSFGVLLLEIVSGRRAIDVDHSPASVLDWAAPLIWSGRVDEVWDPAVGRPEGRLYGALREVVVVAARCVRGEADDRPEMEEVVRWLRMAAGRRAAIWRWVSNRLCCRNTFGNGRVSDVAA